MKLIDFKIDFKIGCRLGSGFKTGLYLSGLALIGSAGAPPQAEAASFPTAQAAFEASEACIAEFRRLAAQMQEMQMGGGAAAAPSSNSTDASAPSPILVARTQALACLAPNMNWWFYHAWEKAQVYPYFLISAYETELKAPINFLADGTEASAALSGCRMDRLDPLRRAYCIDILTDWYSSYGASIDGVGDLLNQMGSEIFDAGSEADAASYQMPESTDDEKSAKVDRMTDIVNWWWDRGALFVPDTETDENFMFKKVIALETDQMRLDGSNWDTATNILWLDYSIDVNTMQAGTTQDFSQTGLDVYKKYLPGHEQDYGFYSSFAPQLFPYVSHQQFGSVETKKAYLSALEEAVTKEKELWNGFASLARMYIENFDSDAYALGLWNQADAEKDEPLRTAHSPEFVKHGLKHLADALRQRDMMEVATVYYRIDDVFLKTDASSRAYRGSHVSPGVIDYPDTVASFEELDEWAKKPIAEKIRRPFPTGPVSTP